ncbi:tRNA glutamyl-Q(34) synthetase GluQRS [Ramlibacter sp. H39-3-26]|uniref:tRNA glutamyl-Q(34) synthetase GluQRS n=1 Tax=Curvibacter soli TaxID=3031331 RepID=UPI0023DB19D1|nr:tRNA glutamyl-Q(34) synthetase GluQRS [Ramlibacter sp. H39-3-26]MDF1485130.1 tRNA glutamyl-Q(34) synthetase GluQRS [Ramlibacter sp. H39-3-26]
MRYTGRFAPSPTGPLHAGSLVAALASWLDARAAGGRWLVRIEDVDTPRCVPGADQAILRQLAQCGLLPDAPPVWQSTRVALYRRALDHLVADGLAYPCGCSRSDIAAALAAQGLGRARHAAARYPGTCRHGLNGKAPRAWRLRTDICKPNTAPALDKPAAAAINTVAKILHWNDRRLGPQAQDVDAAVGDFVLLRADGLWAYQLAVVVDDADQGVSDVVRGEDLTDNTARQILLQRALGLPTPRYLHTPLVRGANGEKLSKQNGAAALDTAQPLRALAAAARVLGLPAAAPGAAVPEALAAWVRAWPGALYNPAP